MHIFCQLPVSPKHSNNIIIEHQSTMSQSWLLTYKNLIIIATWWNNNIIMFGY